MQQRLPCRLWRTKCSLGAAGGTDLGQQRGRLRLGERRFERAGGLFELADPDQRRGEPIDVDDVPAGPGLHWRANFAVGNDQDVRGVDALEPVLVVIGGLAAPPTSSDPIFHSVLRSRPGSGCPRPAAFVAALPSSRHRMPRTWWNVGAVETTNASQGGWVSIHQAITRAAMNDFPTPCRHGRRPWAGPRVR